LDARTWSTAPVKSSVKPGFCCPSWSVLLFIMVLINVYDALVVLVIFLVFFGPA
jgi:hypothetical protein